MTDVLEAPTTARTWWDDVLDWTGSVRAIAVLRIALGPITLLHLRPFLRDARRGIAYDDHFWHPFFTWLPHLPGRAWFAMLWIGAVAAVLMTIGLWTRVATATAFAVVATNLVLSTTHVHNNRTFLMIILGAMALLPSGNVLSVDAWWRRRAGRPARDVARLWPLWMLRVQVCLVYFTSGFSKLIDRDWVGGLVMWDRVRRFRHVLDPTPLPSWAIDLLMQRWFYVVLAPLVVGTELFIGVGLFVRRTRFAAVWMAIAFHVFIEISASVEVFSILGIAALSIWVEPVTRQHVVSIGGADGRGRLARFAVRAGDWFARFEVVPAADGSSLAVTDVRGDVHSGADAVVFLLRRMPLTFVVAAPVSFVAGALPRKRASASPTGRRHPAGSR